MLKEVQRQAREWHADLARWRSDGDKLVEHSIHGAIQVSMACRGKVCGGSRHYGETDILTRIFFFFLPSLSQLQRAKLRELHGKNESIIGKHRLVLEQRFLILFYEHWFFYGACLCTCMHVHMCVCVCLFVCLFVHDSAANFPNLCWVRYSQTCGDLPTP